jgi:hypothetical protein
MDEKKVHTEFVGETSWTTATWKTEKDMLSGCEDERGRKINKNMSNGEYRYLQY